MTSGTKCKNCRKERDQHCDTDDHREFLEKDEVSAEEASATSKSSDTSTEDADTHLSIGLPHLLLPLLVFGVHVIGRQVDDVVNGEANQNDDRNGFGNT